MGLTGRMGGPESSAPPAAARVSTVRGGSAAAAPRVDEEEEERWSISSLKVRERESFVGLSYKDVHFFSGRERNEKKNVRGKD